MMKNLKFVLVAAFAAVAFTGCNNVPQANMNNTVDSLSYMIGLDQATQMKKFNYLAQYNVDSTNIDQFIKGFVEGVKMAEDKNQETYFFGMNLGMQCAKQMVPSVNQNTFGNDSTKSISVDNLVAGFIKGFKDKQTGMQPEEIRNNLMRLDSIVKVETYSGYKKEGEKFLAENAKKEGVNKTESGLQYKVITEGTGAVAKTGDKVNVKYTGTLIDGTEFDSSRGEAVEFPVDQVVPGFSEALKMMPAGSKWQIVIPYELAYGTRMMGNIKPYSVLIFDLEVVSVKEAKQNDAK